MSRKRRNSLRSRTIGNLRQLEGAMSAAASALGTIIFANLAAAAWQFMAQGETLPALALMGMATCLAIIAGTPLKYLLEDEP